VTVSATISYDHQKVEAEMGGEKFIIVDEDTGWEFWSQNDIEHSRGLSSDRIREIVTKAAEETVERKLCTWDMNRRMGNEKS